MTDRELILRISKADDLKAFDELFRRYYRASVTLSSVILKDEDLARDIVQDVFMRLWTGRARLDADRSVKALISTSVRNASINVLKSRHTVIFSALGTVPEPLTENTAMSVGFADSRRKIREIVEEMPPVRRQVFRMSREEGKDAETIATELKISRRTVDKHLELALKDIRQKFS